MWASLLPSDASGVWGILLSLEGISARSAPLQTRSLAQMKILQPYNRNLGPYVL